MESGGDGTPPTVYSLVDHPMKGATVRCCQRLQTDP